eukprot:TRINITY_DN8786_c0_g1_i3.p1 TRINITY_DN8786_c0_g1~~TRINITY_DN8786_c0_g1_i3.p1  ORF type:complete len:114 (-),score=10.21 TRINITY_DN8786_c0_g1_i3:158-499(-)
MYRYIYSDLLIAMYRLYFFFFFKQKTAYEMLRSLVGSEMCIRDRSTGRHSIVVYLWRVSIGPLYLHSRTVPLYNHPGAGSLPRPSSLFGESPLRHGFASRVYSIPNTTTSYIV